MTPPRTFALDGRRTTSLAAAYAELGEVLIGRADWGASADALERLLRDVVGTPPVPVRLVWQHAGVARAALDRDATVRERTAELRDCAPHVLIRTAWALRAALRGTGPTLFETLTRQLAAVPHVTLVLEDDTGAASAAG